MTIENIDFFKVNRFNIEILFSEWEFCILRSNRGVMKNVFYTIATLLLLSIVSCKSDDDKTEFTPFETVNNQATHSDSYYSAGLGENPGIPAGPLYKLPSGVEVVGYIHGNAPAVLSLPQFDKEKNPGLIPVENNDKANWVTYGYGSLVNLYFTLQNTNSTSITVTIPKGTVCFEADHVPSYQHGLLVKSVDIVIPANDSADVHLALFCINAHHGIASATVPYRLGVITIHPDFVTVCNILNAKAYIDPSNYGTIQTIIWKITDNGGFGQADIDALNAM
jgi:hypothetical protein